MPRTAEHGELALEEVAELEELREDWGALGPATGNVFATYEWAAAWARHIGGGRPLHLRRCRSSDGRTVAILPLYLAAPRPTRTLRLLGHGPADQSGLVCAPEDLPLAAGALRRALDERIGGWQFFVADNVRADERWPELIGGRTVKRDASPVLRVDGTSFDEFLAGRSRNFREQARRRERKLARAHDISFRLADDPERIDADMDTLIRLHRARWGDESGSFDGAREGLHRDFAPAALERGWLRLWLLEADGAPVAAWYGFRFGDAEWYYQAGRDPAWDDRSVGFVLMVHTVREAMNDGVAEYRLLRGAHEYKDRFANSETPVDTVVRTRGVAGRAAGAAVFTARRMPPRVRRALIKRAG